MTAAHGGGAGDVRRSLTVFDPEGQSWSVRIVRWDWPRWRTNIWSGIDDDDSDLFGSALVLVANMLGALIAVTVLPLLYLAVELPLAALRGLFSPRRLVVATHAGVAPSRMTWRTDVAHAPAVAEQVATQLRLGYERVEPHRAVFLGFSRPGGDGGE